MEMSPYKNAKMSKLKELQKILYELMAKEGADEEMDVGDVMEQAEQESSPDPDAAQDASGGEEEAMSELQQMKKDYFKPKAKERAPGAGVMVASMRQAHGVKPSFTSPAKKSFVKSFK